MPIDPRFIIELKGKSFVLVAGLLDLAHSSGLRSVTTEVVPELSNPAEQSWVVRAIGIFRPEGGEDSVWSAYGDACPANSQMRGAYLRHAETRAVARMCRFATNVGMAAVEELGPDMDAEPPPPRVQTSQGKAYARHEGTADTSRAAARSQNSGVQGPAPPESQPATESPQNGVSGSRCEDCGKIGLTQNEVRLGKQLFKVILCSECRSKRAVQMAKIASSPAV